MSKDFSKFVAEALVFNGKDENNGEDLTPEEKEKYHKQRYWDELYGSGSNIVESRKEKKKKPVEDDTHSDKDKFVGKYDRKTKIIIHPDREQLH